ncbi:MAG: CBS domain-containing protein [Bacteroidia bacterium]|nr:CBS domain-containing protein [Bacteroidia bacterium]
MLIAHDLINNEITPLKISDTGELALKWMDEYKVRHLPIVNNTQLLGVIAETDLLDQYALSHSLESFGLSLLRPYILSTEHIYEVIKTITSLKLSILPVVDVQQNYLGIITLETLINKVALMASINEPGGLIVLNINAHDYSLSQIAQIVEGNDAKILSSYITGTTDSTKTEVTIKVNKEDLSPILQTLYRYDYHVVASYHHSEYEEDLKRRLESFMNYLNM